MKTLIDRNEFCGAFKKGVLHKNIYVTHANHMRHRCAICTTILCISVAHIDICAAKNIFGFLNSRFFKNLDFFEILEFLESFPILTSRIVLIF
jgi:hypothetical protein